MAAASPDGSEVGSGGGLSAAAGTRGKDMLEGDRVDDIGSVFANEGPEVIRGEG